jgi:phosphohistidine phosphatase
VKRLLLLRHGKAVPADPGIEDHERDLLPRGRQDAPAIGRYMAESGYVPDVILSSTSRRTAETAELVAAELPMRTIDYVETLYLAAPPALLAAIRGQAENVQTLLLVGHNPGVERLAAALAREPVRRKERDRFDLIEEKFPTAALAVLDFAVLHWRDVTPGQGELIDFVRPRDL